MLQTTLVGGSVFYLMSMPILLAYYPDVLPSTYTTNAFFVSLLAVTFVMSIRPLADLFRGKRWIRSLVILRKGFGVTSASIVVAFILSKIITHGLGTYLASWFSVSYWSLDGYALFAHLGDLSAIVLLVTSNNFSKRILGKGWKRVQKLAYVYFFSGALYEVFAFGSSFAEAAAWLVGILVFAAIIRNRLGALHTAQTSSPQSAHAAHVRVPQPYSVEVHHSQP